MGRVDFFAGVFVVCILFAITPGLVCAAIHSESDLSGTVFADGSNDRLANTTVTVCDDAGNPLQQTVTNESGEFTFRGLHSTRYILKVQANGFETAEIHVDAGFAAERGLTVVLKPASKAVAKSASTGLTISAHELSMPEEARDLVVSGRKDLYVDRDSKAALAKFQSAIAKAPTYYEAYLQEGMAYLSLQDSARAEQSFRKAVDQSEKKCADADIALGILLLQQGQVAEGESLLRLGLAGNPASWPGQFELGKLELSRDHLPPALAAAEAAKSAAPHQAVVYRLLAAIHLRQQNYAAMIPDIDCYLQLDPDSRAATRARELRAEAERQLGNERAAVAVK